MADVGGSRVDIGFVFETAAETLAVDVHSHPPSQSLSYRGKQPVTPNPDAARRNNGGHRRART
jgi:hypothetical protein